MTSAERRDVRPKFRPRLGTLAESLLSALRTHASTSDAGASMANLRMRMPLHLPAKFSS